MLDATIGYKSLTVTLPVPLQKFLIITFAPLLLLLRDLTSHEDIVVYNLEVI